MNPDSASPETIFGQAIALDSPTDRALFLDRACGNDSELRLQIEKLVADHFKAGKFLESPAPGLAETISIPIETPGQKIGPYKLLEKLGEGGMGTVWIAEREHPKQRVALKLIKPGMDSKAVLRRFDAERQALALMSHNNIAKMLDAGTTQSGRPYFVMELVKGVPITKYCDETHSTLQDRLKLFISVCMAVQHAHQKGIIHRDIKPSNVLICMEDGKPVPKVIDFGVAKALHQPLTDGTLHTDFNQIVGTLEYMSPEQAELNALDIDTRTDIYGLGVLLFELLTGTTPVTPNELRQVAVVEMLRKLKEMEPRKPSTRLSESKETIASVAALRRSEPAKLMKDVRGDLDWIVLKCLESDRTRRYETANALVRDVERHLANEPVEAGPPSVRNRLRKFVRRNKVGLLVGSLLLTLFAGLTSSIGWTVRDCAARHRQLSDAAELALIDADRAQKSHNWPQARAAVLRAQSLLATGDGDGKQMQLAANLLKDLDMVAQLEEIRLETDATMLIELRNAELKAKSEKYAQAFRNYGIDVETLPAEEAAIRIRQKSIAVELITGLDDWANNWPLVSPRSKSLQGIARRADPDDDPWRRRLRSALEEGDTQTIKILAADDMQQSMSPGTVLLLVRALTGKVSTVKLLTADKASVQLAIKHLKKAQLLYPDDFWINFSLYEHLIKSQPPQLNEGLGFLRAAVALRSHSPAAWITLGMELSHSGDHIGGIAAAQKAVALMPDNALINNNYGTILAANKDLVGAIAAFQKAVALKPDFAGAHLNLGIALTEKGDLAGAIAAFQKAVVLEPDLAGVHQSLGYALFVKGDLAGAMAAIQKAIELEPDSVHARNILGRILFKKGDLAGSIVAYQKAITLKPDYAEAHCNLGNSLLVKGDLTGAISACQKAISLSPNLSTAYLNLGSALHAKGDSAGSVAAYRKAITLRPDYILAHSNLGSVLQGQGEFRQALVSFRRALELQTKNKNPSSSFPLAKAVRDCERYIELDEKLPAFLAGKLTPTNAAEQMDLAKFCALKHMNHAAVRFFEGGFAAEPQLTNDLEKGLRYDAACAAAQAGCGQGKESTPLDDKECARHRRQALDWLRSDLKAWHEQVEKESDNVLALGLVRRTLNHWQLDGDLAGVRDPEQLVKLPSAEQDAWRSLWSDVTTTLELANKAEEKRKP